MSDSFDPYYQWLGIPPKDQPPTFYRLLGIEVFESNANVIDNAADRQMAHIRTCGIGARSEDSQQILNELAAARVCLLDPENKSAYDDQLKWELATAMPGGSESSLGNTTPSATPGGLLSTATDFLEELTGSGLLTKEEALEATRTATAPDGNARQFAEALVESGHLTEFQATSAFQRKTKNLFLGDYVLLERIGSGGMGQVFKAVHRRMKRVVAVKLLREERTADADSIKRFQREVEAAARLEHRNIVTAYDAGKSDNVHYLVMQYVDGRDLSSLVRQYGPLSFEETINYVLQVAAGLAYAHAEGIVHRDIKPANLLLDTHGTVKILDMGLASIQESPVPLVDGAALERLTSDGELMGTVTYMSPEQAADPHAADHRTDIYSLGCTMFRLLVGRPLYSGDNPLKVFLAHHEAQIPSLCEARPDLPQRLESIFRKMVAKSAHQRFQSIDEFLTDLEELMAGSLVTLPIAGSERTSQQFNEESTLAQLNNVDTIRNQPSSIPSTQTQDRDSGSRSSDAESEDRKSVV